jgi:hypothetical protein
MKMKRPFEFTIRESILLLLAIDDAMEKWKKMEDPRAGQAAALRAGPVLRDYRALKKKLKGEEGQSTNHAKE